MGTPMMFSVRRCALSQDKTTPPSVALMGGHKLTFTNIVFLNPDSPDNPDNLNLHTTCASCLRLPH